MPGHGPQDFTTAQSTDRTFRNDNLELGHHIKNVIEHLHRMLNSACEQLHASTEPKAHGTHSRINAEARNLHDSISAMHEELGQIISQASREMAWVTAQKIAEMGSRGVILLVDDVEQDEESMTAVRNKVNVVFNKLRNNLTASWNDWTTGIRRADREVSGECETVVSQAEREDYRRAYPDLTDEVMDAWRSPSPQEDPVPDINPAPDDTNENIRSRFDELFWKTEQWARENAISRIGEGQESDFKDWCMEKKLLIRNDRWLRSSDIDSEVCRHTPLILCAAIANGICHAVLSNSFFFVQGIHPINDHNQVVYRDVDLSMLLQGMAHEICQGRYFIYPKSTIYY